MTPVTAIWKFYVYISGAWVELLDEQPTNTKWGMSDNKPETRIGDIGEMSVTLNNYDGRYTPGGATALAGWKRGLYVKKVVTYNDSEKIKFYGVISDIKLESSANTYKVKITVLDWFDYASKYPVVNPALLEDATIDAGVDILLADIPVTPQDSEIQIGNFVFPYLFDSVQGGTKAYTELAKFALSELSYSYLRHSGTYGETLVIENSDARNGTNTPTEYPDVGTVNFDDSVISYRDIRFGENIINRFTANAYPKKTDEDAVEVYATEKPIYLSANETKTFRIFWRDPVGKRPINAVPPTGAGGVVALLPFVSADMSGGAASGGLDGVWLDHTGKIAEHFDVPFIAWAITGDGSSYFDGSSAWIEYPDSSDWDFGSGDFWVEWYEYRYATAANNTIISRDGTDSTPSYFFGISNGTNNTVSLSSNGSSFDIASGVSMGAITINTWTHFAAGRDNGTLYTFKNGTLVTSVSAAGTIFPSTSNLYIGRNVSNYFAGNISNLFIVKGKCLHTATFTNYDKVPVMLEGVYHEFNTAVDFTGTDIKDNVTISAIYGTEGATFTTANTGTQSGYLDMRVFAYGIYSDSPVEVTVEDADSIVEYGYQNINLSQAYQKDSAIGEQEGKRVIEFEHAPRIVLNEIGFAANRSPSMMSAYLSADVGDLIPVQLTDEAIDSWFYIQGVRDEMRGGLIFPRWTLKRGWFLGKGLEHVAVEFAGNAEDRIDFGYIPLVSADEVNSRIFSAWIYLDAVTASYDQIIMGTKNDAAGVSLYIDAHASDVLLSFDANSFATGGKWTITANSFSVGQWVHVVCFYRADTTARNPIIYINGTYKTVTENTAPSGASLSEEGLSLVLGNNSSGTACFNGKIKDARIYDVSKITVSLPTLIAGLYAEGAGGSGYYDGMKFCAFTVKTEDEASYNDLTLTNEKLLDGYLWNVGTPTGSPIVRLL